MHKLVALTLASLVMLAACGDDDTTADDAGHDHKTDSGSKKDSGGSEPDSSSAEDSGATSDGG
jgi:hypothetical protein